MAKHINLLKEVIFIFNDLFALISDTVTDFITAFTTQSTIYNGFMSFLTNNGPLKFEGQFTYADVIYTCLMALVVFFIIYGIVKLFKSLLSIFMGGFSNVG